MRALTVVSEARPARNTYWMRTRRQEQTRTRAAVRQQEAILVSGGGKTRGP